MTDGAEARRLADAGAGVPWRQWGPYLSERQWGTVREDYSPDGDAWGYVPHDHSRLALVSVGRGRPGRRLRRSPAAVPRPRPLERQRPDPQGAAVRAHQRRGQPRRGREGVLLLRRQRADALVPAMALQVPARRLPVRRPDRGQCPPRLRRHGVRADRHRRLRRRRATSTSSSSTRRPTSTTWSAGSRSPTAVPRRRRSTSSRHCGSATRGRSSRNDPMPSISRVEPGSAVPSSPSTASSARCTCTRPAGAELLFCDNESNARRLWNVDGMAAYPKDGINDHVVSGMATVNPAGIGTKVAASTQLTIEPGATQTTSVRLTSAATVPDDHPAGRRRRGRGDTAGGSRRVLRVAPPGAGIRRGGHGHAPGLRRDALVEAVLLLRRRPVALGTQCPPDAPPDVSRPTAQRVAGSTCSTPT